MVKVGEVKTVNEHRVVAVDGITVNTAWKCDYCGERRSDWTYFEEFECEP